MDGDTEAPRSSDSAPVRSLACQGWSGAQEGRGCAGKGGQSPTPCPTPGSWAGPLSPRRLWRSPLTEGPREEGSECGAGQRQPPTSPFCGERSPCPHSEWVGGREATVGEQPDVSNCPRRVVAAVLGLGVLGAERRAQRGNARPFPRMLSPGPGRREQQGRVTGAEGHGPGDIVWLCPGTPS